MIVENNKFHWLKQNQSIIRINVYQKVVDVVFNKIITNAQINKCKAIGPLTMSWRI